MMYYDNCANIVTYIKCMELIPNPDTIEVCIPNIKSSTYKFLVLVNIDPYHSCTQQLYQRMNDNSFLYLPTTPKHMCPDFEDGHSEFYDTAKYIKYHIKLVNVGYIPSNAPMLGIYPLIPIYPFVLY